MSQSSQGIGPLVFYELVICKPKPTTNEVTCWHFVAYPEATKM